jgi:hypothetical protein
MHKGSMRLMASVNPGRVELRVGELARTTRICFAPSATRTETVFLLLWPTLGLLLLAGACGGSGGSGGSGGPPPAPTVTVSLNPSTIAAGESSNLTWTSTGATSCTGNGAWSGSQSTTGSQTVTPSSPGSLNYGLSCTGSGGNGTASATLTVNPHILADANTPGPLISSDQFGANMSVGYDITNPASQAATLKSAGVKLVRWPGGSPADDCHWETSTWSPAPCDNFGGPNPNSTFANFESVIIAAGAFDLAVTLNYGSNEQCTGPADPNEAAQWVGHAKQNNENVKYWTAGNEVYGANETDLHSPGAHDPTTYASNVATQFYPLIKAQDANAQVRVVVDGGNYTSDNWDSIVLANAMYDFVELHYYPENPGSENDSFLLTQAPPKFASTFTKLQQELANAGKPNTPIYLGEYNSPNYNPGKQTVSIVNALFIGMVQGEILKAGINAATINDGFFGECNDGGNMSSSLYGWQNFGSYALFAGSVPTCNGAVGIPANTPFPIARALALSTEYGVAGNNVLGVTVSTALLNVRAYAAEQGSGYALMLFNLDESNPATVYIGVANSSASSYTATLSTYDKSIYDQSQSGTWAAPSVTPLGTVTLPFSVTLSAWSMNVLVLK